MKVAIYTRVSTSDQNLDMQIKELKEYAKKRNWDIYKIYQDTISGSTTSRPELDQMMKEANQRKFDILLVWKFDRFARSLQMLVESLNTFNTLGIDFVSYKENIDTTTPMGKLIFHINSAYAEFEREIIRERVKAGVRNKRDKLKKQGITEWGRRELDPKIQQRIRNLRQQGLSIRGIAKGLVLSKTTVGKYL